MEHLNSLNQGAPHRENLGILGSVGRLDAVLSWPADGGRVPLAVLCHGFTGTRDDSLLLALDEALLAAGIGTLRFDFNGHGKSEGLFQQMTIPGEIEDLRRVCAYAVTLRQVTALHLVGHSQGAVVAAMAAGEFTAEESITISSVALLSVAGIIKDDLILGRLLGQPLQKPNSQGVMVRFGPDFPVGGDYVRTGRELKLYETAARFDGPVLLLHGRSDQVVPYTYSQYLARFLEKPELELIGGADHDFTTCQQEVAQRVADFLQNPAG